MSSGFRRFITTAQTERMQFAEEEGIFAKYLPYAIVFGATRQWAKRFEGLGEASPAMGGMGWYVSPYLFNPIGFSDSMQTSRCGLQAPSCPRRRRHQAAAASAASRAGAAAAAAAGVGDNGHLFAPRPGTAKKVVVLESAQWWTRRS